MPTDREILETVRNVIADAGESGINSLAMANALASVLAAYTGRPRSRKELRDLVLTEAGRLGVRAIDAPN
jgi:hypothetical protein